MSKKFHFEAKVKKKKGWEMHFEIKDGGRCEGQNHWNLWALSNLCSKLFYNSFSFGSANHLIPRPPINSLHEFRFCCPKMPKTVGVTHADLAPSRRSTELGSKTGVAFIVVTIICGLFCFVLCLIAEATRSQEKWVESGEDGKDVKYECIYSGSGKMALLCSAVAFVGLAVVMLVEHMYMLIAVSKSPPPVLLSWDPDSTQFKTLTWQAGFFFVTTWLI
ncbi:hypothetical protein V6Z11_A10G196900 [Gossypium hirsutum]